MKQGKKLTAAERLAKLAADQDPSVPHADLEASESPWTPPATLSETDWSPERKIVGAAIATLLAFGVQHAAGVDFPPGAEGALGVVVGYLLPNKR